MAPHMTQKHEIVDYMLRMKARGARIQLNHPFHRGLGWSVGWDVPFDYFEAWNRQFDKGGNADAIAWWHRQLVDGKRITATGGTDSHTTKSERYPVNCLFCRERSTAGILAALDEGRAFITESAYGPWLQLKIGGCSMGDEVTLSKIDSLEIFAEHVEPGYYMKVFSDRGVELEERIRRFSYRKTLEDIGGRRFFRSEVWRGETLIALSNPIYIRQLCG